MGFMKIYLLVISMVWGAFASSWKNTAVTSITANQNSNHNWVAGGQDALAWQIGLDATSEGSFVLWTWKNQLQLAYGRTQIGDDKSRKHLDKIFFESMLQYNLRPYLKPYVSGRLESQFTTTYEYSDTVARRSISEFWDPGYLTESVGLSWIPGSLFQTRLGFALKQTFSKDHGWADDPETVGELERFRNEPGLESISELGYSFNDLLKFRSRLSAFVNFEGVDAVDGRWENALDAQVSKYLVFSAGVEMLYDKDIDEDSQLRQSVSVGLTYTMF